MPVFNRDDILAAHGLYDYFYRKTEWKTFSRRDKSRVGRKSAHGIAMRSSKGNPLRYVHIDRLINGSLLLNPNAKAIYLDLVLRYDGTSARLLAIKNFDILTGMVTKEKLV